MTILSCIQKRSLPLSDGCGWAVEAGARVYSSSGVLYNSSSFFTALHDAATTSIPRFRGPLSSPLARLDSFSTPFADGNERESARHRRLGDNGSHQASGINYARLSPREKLRPGPKLELVARVANRGEVVGQVFCSMSFFVYGSGSLASRVNSRFPPGVPGCHSWIPLNPRARREFFSLNTEFLNSIVTSVTITERDPRAKLTYNISRATSKRRAISRRIYLAFPRRDSEHSTCRSISTPGRN